MLNSTTRIKHWRFIIASNKRSFTDPVTWLVFFFLTIGFCTLHFLNMFYLIENPSCGFLEFVANGECVDGAKKVTPMFAFLMILENSLIYTLFMMVPVYFNLLVLKKTIIDKSGSTVLSYMPYLLAVLVNALLFAWLMILLYNIPDFMEVKFRYIVNVLTIFGTQLVASGLLFRRETLEYIRELERSKKRAEKIKEENLQLKEKLQDIEISGDSNVLKVGTKKSYKIIQLENILYLQGDGNEPLIFTDDTARKYRGSKTMGDYKEHLPADKFIQVHRSYIVAKDKVIGRKGNTLILKGGNEIPISKSYEAAVENDEYIGFQPNAEKEIPSLKNGNL